MNKFLNRRKFIYTSTLGIAASALVHPVFSYHPRVSKNKLGVALVGLGNYATNQLAPALQETDHCYLSGIVTGTPSKEKVWQKKYGIPDANIYNYDNYDEIANNKAIDIIYVVLPNSMHAEYTIRAAKAGKHVICEKPMAISVDECNSMISACEEAGVKLSIGYRLHYEPHNQSVMEIGQKAEFGPLKFMNTEFGFRLSGAGQWRLDKKLAGGGALMDVGVYAIQAARYTTGQEPIAVTAKEYKTNKQLFDEVDETILWQMEFEDGMVANSATSYAARMERLYGAAEGGWFELRPAYSYGGIKGKTHKGPMDFPQVNQQAKHMDAFALNVKDDTTPLVTGEEGLKDMKVVEAIYKSINDGGKRVLL